MWWRTGRNVKGRWRKWRHWTASSPPLKTRCGKPWTGRRQKAGQLAGPLQARRKELADAVAVFARLNRQELFAKSKSLDMGFGVIGFRASTKIVQIRGVTAEMTLEKLHQYNLSDGIRTKEEINKDAALGWPDERLELVGLKRQQSDTFFIEISKENVPQGTA